MLVMAPFMTGIASLLRLWKVLKNVPKSAKSMLIVKDACQAKEVEKEAGVSAIGVSICKDA